MVTVGSSAKSLDTMHLGKGLWLVGQISLLVQASHNHHGHHHHHHARSHDLHIPESASHVSGSVHAVTSSGPYAAGETSDAADAVARALKVLKQRNKLRLENVQHNNYKLRAFSDKSSDPNSRPLDYSPKAAETSTDSNNQTIRRSSDTKENYGYSIPPELREAARILAESTPPSPSTGNHSAVAALMREKYRSGISDTSIPLQSYRTYDGLSDIVMQNNQSVPSGNSIPEEGLGKRASSSWWMATMVQRGANPYAPSGYKVWLLFIL